MGRTYYLPVICGKKLISKHKERNKDLMGNFTSFFYGRNVVFFARSVASVKQANTHTHIYIRPPKTLDFEACLVYGAL